MEYLNLTDIIDKGHFKDMTVNEIIEQDRHNLITLCKDGYNFSDEVFEKAKYKRIIRDVKVTNEVIFDRPKIKEKPLPKDTKSLKEILKSLSTIDNISINENYDVAEDNIEEEVDLT